MIPELQGFFLHFSQYFSRDNLLVVHVGRGNCDEKGEPWERAVEKNESNE